MFRVLSILLQRQKIKTLLKPATFYKNPGRNEVFVTERGRVDERKTMERSAAECTIQKCCCKRNRNNKCIKKVVILSEKF